LRDRIIYSFIFRCSLTILHVSITHSSHDFDTASLMQNNFSRYSLSIVVIAVTSRTSRYRIYRVILLTGKLLNRNFHSIDCR